MLYQMIKLKWLCWLFVGLASCQTSKYEPSFPPDPPVQSVDSCRPYEANIFSHVRWGIGAKSSRDKTEISIEDIGKHLAATLSDTLRTQLVAQLKTGEEWLRVRIYFSPKNLRIPLFIKLSGDEGLIPKSMYPIWQEFLSEQREYCAYCGFLSYWSKRGEPVYAELFLFWDLFMLPPDR